MKDNRYVESGETSTAFGYGASSAEGPIQYQNPYRQYLYKYGERYSNPSVRKYNLGGSEKKMNGIVYGVNVS